MDGTVLALFSIKFKHTAAKVAIFFDSIAKKTFFNRVFITQLSTF